MPRITYYGGLAREVRTLEDSALTSEAVGKMDLKVLGSHSGSTVSYDAGFVMRVDCRHDPNVVLLTMQ